MSPAGASSSGFARGRGDGDSGAGILRWDCAGVTVNVGQILHFWFHTGVGVARWSWRSSMLPPPVAVVGALFIAAGMGGRILRDQKPGPKRRLTG